MNCPKCGKATLEDKGHYRWKCPYIEPAKIKTLKNGKEKTIPAEPCGFMCGLSFFFDDDNLDVDIEVGFRSTKNLKVSQRATDIMKTEVLSLREADQFEEMKNIESIRLAEEREEELDELNSMMRNSGPVSTDIHKHTSDGGSYRKNRGGGLIGRKLG